MIISTEQWEEVKKRVKYEYNIPNVSYEVWIKELKLYRVVEDSVIIMIPADIAHAKEYLENKYGNFIVSVMDEVFQKNFKVEFMVEICRKSCCYCEEKDEKERLPVKQTNEFLKRLKEGNGKLLTKAKSEKTMETKWVYDRYYGYICDFISKLECSSLNLEDMKCCADTFRVILVKKIEDEMEINKSTNSTGDNIFSLEELREFFREQQISLGEFLALGRMLGYVDSILGDAEYKKRELAIMLDKMSYIFENYGEKELEERLLINLNNEKYAFGIDSDLGCSIKGIRLLEDLMGNFSVFDNIMERLY